MNRTLEPYDRLAGVVRKPREPALKAARPRVFVYVGGMAAVRSIGRIASTSCVGCAVLFLCSVLLQGRTGHLAFLGFMYVAAVLLAIGNRLVMLRSVIVKRDGWMLVPLLGRPRHMPPLADVYEQGDDVIALGIDGRTTVLGVDRFPLVKQAIVRSSLVQALRGNLTSD
jgi:hypothetical protein